MKRLFTIILSLFWIVSQGQETPPNGTKAATTNQAYIGPDSTYYLRIGALPTLSPFYTQMVRAKALRDSLFKTRKAIDSILGNYYYTKAQTDARIAAAIAAIPTPNYPVVSVNSKTGAVVLNKNDIGLGNVDNTADLAKPISSATQSALDLKANITYVNSQDAALTQNINNSINYGIVISGTAGQNFITDSRLIAMIPKGIYKGKFYTVGTDTTTARDNPARVRFNITTGTITFDQNLLTNEQVWVMYSASGNTSVVPGSVALKSDLDALKSVVDTVSAAVFQTSEIAKSSDASVSSFYINASGAITASVPSYSVFRYPVQAGKTYYVRGVTANAATNIAMSGAMFKTSADLSGSGTVILSIPNATPVGTSLSATFPCTTSGYLFVTRWSDVNVLLSVSEEQKTSRFIAVNQSIVNLNSAVTATNVRIDTLNSQVYQTVQVPKTSIESATSFYVSTSGAITSAAASYSVVKYSVQAGKTYHIRGVTANASTNVSMAGAMFKTSPDISGSGAVIFTIPNPTPPGTSLNATFPCTTNGYIFVSKWASNVVLSVFEDQYVSKITTLGQNVSSLSSSVSTINTRVDSISAQIYTSVETVKTSAETISSRYVTTAGAIATASASYSVIKYVVQAGKSYRVKGVSTAVTTTGFSVAMFKTSGDMSGTGTSLMSVPNGYASGSQVNYVFNCTTDGFLFVTNWTNLSIVTYDITGGISKLNILEQELVNLQAQVNALGGIDAIDHFTEITSNPLKQVNTTPGLTSIFHSWGFIGDSLTSGQHEYFDGGVKKFVNFYDYSWGQQICKASGSEGYNFSIGGQTAKNWNASSDIRAWGGAQTNLKKSYIISMGTNDRNNFNSSLAGSYPAGNVSTDINTSNWTLNADTYAGHMGGIIQRLRSVQPKARIFLVTLPKGASPDGTNVELWNTVVRNLAAFFPKVYVIDIYNYGAVETSAFRSRYYMGGHMNSAGYQYRAYQFMTYIDWIVRKNQLDFAEEAFVGTPYSYY